MKTYINFFVLVCLCFSTIFLSGMDGCNTGEEPAVFVSATPSDGSTIQEGATIVAVFDAPPQGLDVSGGEFKLSGKGVIITGPFVPGRVSLVLTWTDGVQVLTYTVAGKSADPSGDEPENPPTDPSLILSLSFDKIADHNVIDDSQYRNDGILIGNPLLAKGISGDALEFNSIRDWVEVPHDESLTVDGDVTVMAWIQTPRHEGPRGAGWQGIIAKGNNPRSYSFYTESGGGLHLSVSNFQGAPLKGSNSTHQVALNQWVHVVAQVDSGVHRYWIDGINRGNFDLNATLPGGADRAAVRIGNTHENLRTFLGLIDEVRIWNRALSEDEIREQMRR